MLCKFFRLCKILHVIPVTIGKSAVRLGGRKVKSKHLNNGGTHTLPCQQIKLSKSQTPIELPDHTVKSRGAVIERNCDLQQMKKLSRSLGRFWRRSVIRIVMAVWLFNWSHTKKPTKKSPMSLAVTAWDWIWLNMSFDSRWAGQKTKRQKSVNVIVPAVQWTAMSVSFRDRSHPEVATNSLPLPDESDTDETPRRAYPSAWASLAIRKRNGILVIIITGSLRSLQPYITTHHIRDAKDTWQIDATKRLQLLLLLMLIRGASASAATS